MTKVSLLPAAFILGVGLLIAALLLQVITYAPGAEVVPNIVALALTITANACFLYIWQRGGWIARVFALLCGAAALFNTSSLLWWVATMLYR